MSQKSQFGAPSFFVQGYAVTFLLLLRVVAVVLLLLTLLLLPRVSGIHFAQLFGVDVSVEVGHEGEDDADTQQEAAEQQELFPLRKRHTKSGKQAELFRFISLGRIEF